MASRPLAVAAVASALLVARLVADASMNRAVHVDVREAGGWRPVASDPYVFDETSRAPSPYGRNLLGANETVEMRLRVDNGYPWAYGETFRAYVNGVEVASGALYAPARGEGEATFSFSASSAAAASEPGSRAGPDAPAVRSLVLFVEAGDARLEAYFEVQEGSA